MIDASARPPRLAYFGCLREASNVSRGLFYIRNRHTGCGIGTGSSKPLEHPLIDENL
jgi:hypothetical protein